MGRQGSIRRRTALFCAFALAAAIAIGGMSTTAYAADCGPGPGANCVDADLRGSNLGGEELSEADFSRANVRGVGFSDAILTDAMFNRARGRGADFQNAFLERTDFTRAELNGAQFYGAYLSATKFARAVLTDVDLSGIQTDGVQGRKATTREVLKAKLCRTTLPDGKVSNRDC